jgi:tRNA(Arg) A34 adenosine deaminase TadA
VGACASTPGGEIVASSRNRVNDVDGPHGEIFGSALAHAETNVLARLPFRRREDLVLTTTLQPCLQCAAAIRLGQVAAVRFAGPDRYWDGVPRLRQAVGARGGTGPAGPERVAVFATLISRPGPALTPGYEKALRSWAKDRWLTSRTSCETAARYSAWPPWMSATRSGACGPGF